MCIRDSIAILHEGRIIANGGLEELKQLLPPAKVEYIERQPSLEEIFLAVTGSSAGTAYRAEPLRGTPVEDVSDVGEERP